MLLKNNKRATGNYMRLAYLALTVLLGGCSGSLEKLQALTLETNDFDASLANEYQGYSESEAEQGHLLTAEYFAAKGLKAAHRETVLPDQPEGDQTMLITYRKQLLSTLTQDVKDVVPQKAARSQLLYDCWLTQEKAHSEQAPCQEEFLSSMNELQEVADEFIFEQELSHRLLFAPESAALDERAQAQLHAIAGYLKQVQDYVLLLTDHAPHKPDAHALAGKRVQAIRELFVASGIRADRIKYANRDNAKEVLLSSNTLEHNAIDIEVRTKLPGGQ
jgi:outer membrane protein OmpA-like peptidoglycan-associated protein